MAYTTINKSTDYFNTKLYTGNGSLPRAITGVGHQPDFVWIKNRDVGYHHQLYDSVRGTSAGVLYSTLTDAEDSTYQLSSFDSDGYTMGSNLGAVNGNGEDIVSWNWKANGAGSYNTDGSITSTVSANTTSGFSIVKWTGSGATATIGHGLGSVPKMIIVKNTQASENWIVYHSTLGSSKHLKLNLTDAEATTGGTWNHTNPTANVFTVHTNTNVNASGNSMIAYCFAEKTGYSKFGKLISNGSDDGTFTYTGFAPKLVILKPNVTDDWSNWYMFDTARDTNLNDKPLYANLNTQEAYYGGSPATNYAQIDILSNGFKIRRDGNWGGGGNGTELIYMAFGQSIVGSNNVPCTAR
jgi:hypothetical protein